MLFYLEININYYIKISMAIKSLQTLVSEIMNQIKTISVDEAYEMFQNENCNLIDIREIN